MELSEHFWPEDLESAIPVVHDIARSPQNPLLLLVVVDRHFDTPLWDFLGQILQPGILAQNRPSRVAVLTPNPAEPKNNLNSEVELRFFGLNQERGARAWLTASSYRQAFEKGRLRFWSGFRADRNEGLADRC